MPIVKFTEKVLHSPCETFSFENPQYDPKKLAEELIREMKLNKGIGLAANQIGHHLRVFAFMDEVAFNPEVIESSDTMALHEEGCISYPGIWLTISRPLLVKARYYTEDGTLVERQLSEMETRVFLHELDHLNGITMIDHASTFKLRRSIGIARKHGYVYCTKELRQSSRLPIHS